jgi:hypothetical protein
VASATLVRVKWLLAASLCFPASAPADEPKPLVAETVGDRVKYETPRATVFFDVGAFPQPQMERFVRLLEHGIADIEGYLQPAEAGAPEVPRITYRIAADIPLSRTLRRTVELPAERVKIDRAPYLHETTHVLMPVRSRSLWLSEGFASFVQSHVAEHVGGYDGYVFSMGGNANVDRLARRYLAREQGRRVLPYVGGPGSPPELWDERYQVAAPFYVLSHSFVKYLVERAGLPAVKELVRAPDVGGALERASKRSLEQWKADWLASLGA